MRFKFTFFLLALNLIVFGLILYLGKRATQHANEDQSLTAIIARELTEADKIILEASSLKQSRVLARSGSLWSLEEPIQWPANQFAVNRILNQLQFMEDEASFSVDEIARNGQRLSDYGLEPPSISLTIFEDEKTVSLGFGTFTEIGNNVYVLGPQGNRIYVVNRGSIDGLLLSLSDLRKREIFEIPVFEVNEMSLQIRSTGSGGTDDLKVRLAKKKGVWAFEAPLYAQANPAQVANTINTLATVTVTDFLNEGDYEVSVTGLDNPFMRVTLFGNKRRQTLLLGNSAQTSELAGEHYFAQIEGNSAVFTVSAVPFTELLAAQEDLRERNFVDFGGKVIDSIYISEGTRQTRLQKLENGTWQVLESRSNGKIEPRRADSQIVQELIDSIQRLRAVEFAVDSPTSVDLERLGFNAPRRVVELFFEGDDQIRLEIAYPDDENAKLYARTDQAEFIYGVDRRSTLGALPLNALHYRNRSLVVLPKSATVQNVEISFTDASEPILNMRRSSLDQVWSGDYGDLSDDQKKAFETIEASIQNFRVKTYLKDFYADGYPLEHGSNIPWEIRIVAEVLYPGSGDGQIREFEYTFTKRLSGTSQIGGSEAQSTMFEIPQEFIEAIYTLTKSFDLPPEAIDEKVPAPAVIEPVPAPANPEGE